MNKAWSARLATELEKSNWNNKWRSVRNVELKHSQSLGRPGGRNQDYQNMEQHTKKAASHGTVSFIGTNVGDHRRERAIVWAIQSLKTKRTDGPAFAARSG
jgi:hypothetical protein